MKRIIKILIGFMVIAYLPGCATTRNVDGIGSPQTLPSKLPPEFILKDEIIYFVGLGKFEHRLPSGKYKPVYIDKEGVYYHPVDSLAMGGVFLNMELTRAVVWYDDTGMNPSYNDVTREQRGGSFVANTGAAGEVAPALGFKVAEVVDSYGIKFRSDVSEQFFEKVELSK
ncbi:MAG: hypothetical protein AB3N10_19405 [Allomuricauda sp.]